MSCKRREAPLIVLLTDSGGGVPAEDAALADAAVPQDAGACVCFSECEVDETVPGPVAFADVQGLFDSCSSDLCHNGGMLGLDVNLTAGASCA